MAVVTYHGVPVDALGALAGLRRARGAGFPLATGDDVLDDWDGDDLVVMIGPSFVSGSRGGRWLGSERWMSAGQHEGPPTLGGPYITAVNRSGSEQHDEPLAREPAPRHSHSGGCGDEMLRHG